MRCSIFLIHLRYQCCNFLLKVNVRLMKFWTGKEPLLLVQIAIEDWTLACQSFNILLGWDHLWITFLSFVFVTRPFFTLFFNLSLVVISQIFKLNWSNWSIFFIDRIQIRCRQLFCTFWLYKSSWLEFLTLFASCFCNFTWYCPIFPFHFYGIVYRLKMTKFVGPNVFT